MKWTLAVVVSVVGALLAGWLWVTWPVPIDTKASPVIWTREVVSEPHVVLKVVGDVEVLRVTGPGERPWVFAALRRGDEVARLEGVDVLHFAELREGRTWALFENSIEGPGESLVVLRSDDGKTFEAWDLEKPSYNATVESWEVERESVAVRCALEPALFASDAWWWTPMMTLPPALRPARYAGGFTVRTRDGGRRWRLVY